MELGLLGECKTSLCGGNDLILLAVVASERRWLGRIGAYTRAGLLTGTRKVGRLRDLRQLGDLWKLSRLVGCQR